MQDISRLYVTPRPKAQAQASIRAHASSLPLLDATAVFAFNVAPSRASEIPLLAHMDVD